jgi:hypothetical protein
MWSTAPAGEWLETTRSIAAYLITHPCHDLHACLGCVSNHSRTSCLAVRLDLDGGRCDMWFSRPISTQASRRLICFRPNLINGVIRIILIVPANAKGVCISMRFRVASRELQ